MAQVQETNNESAKSVFFRVVQFLTIAAQEVATQTATARSTLHLSSE